MKVGLGSVGLETGVGVQLETRMGVGLETRVAGLDIRVGGGLGTGVGGLVHRFSVVYELWTDQWEWRWNPVSQHWASMLSVGDDVRGVVEGGMAGVRSRLQRG